jgi:murein L,D-transpeptidase YafK
MRRTISTMLFLAAGMTLPAQERIDEVRARVEPGLKAQIAATGLAYGAPVFVRIFKESSELELWMKPAQEAGYKLFRTWKIATYSGTLGPKLREGDRQAPEGFYGVTRRQLNPKSNFHLSFNIGYPNALDQALGRTGSLIMVHGSNVSVGCFAMTDPVIEEIYLIVEAALTAGQPEIAVHCFPFRMTPERMAAAGIEASPSVPFWQELQPGYDAFEASRIPPEISVREGRYLVSGKNASNP